jgi:hypothetical protein
MRELFGILGIILLPLGLIWAVNVLFAFAIEYTIQTWAASLILLILFMRGSNVTSWR